MAQCLHSVLHDIVLTGTDEGCVSPTRSQPSYSSSAAAMVTVQSVLTARLAGLVREINRLGVRSLGTLEGTCWYKQRIQSCMFS